MANIVPQIGCCNFNDFSPGKQWIFLAMRFNLMFFPHMRIIIREGDANPSRYRVFYLKLIDLGAGTECASYRFV